MKNVKWAVAGALLTAASSAIAADATFDNHLTSTEMVSPAQLYQIDDLRTDFQLGYQTTDATSKPTGVKESSNTNSGTDLFAAAIYNVKGIGLRAGLTADYVSQSFEDKSVDATTNTVSKRTGDGTDMIVSPQIAYSIGPVVIGAAVDLVQSTVKPQEIDEMKETHTTFRPGVLFQNKDMEAGLVYTSATHKTDEGDAKKLPVNEPATVTAHGRFAVDRNLAVGGILSELHYKGIDEDLYKDQTQVKATGELTTGALKMEGDLGYNTAYYADKDKALRNDTIGTVQLGAAADYSVNKMTAIGGGLGYEFGSDKNDAVKVATNTLTLALRGNMKF